MSAPEIITFGCRLNSLESEVIRGLVGDAEEMVVVNTCAVTGEAERQARQAIRKARRSRPGARIVVTGCAAQIDPQGFAAMPEVDRVLGNAEKLAADSFRRDDPVLVDDIMQLTETAAHLVEGLEGRARAFLQVQNGCDHRCTFCIIPFGRGPSRSVPIGAIVEQARRLTANGHRELVLTGVDLTAYGGDLPGRPRLGTMVRRLLKLVPELQRLRLSSIDAVEADDELLDLIGGEERLMPHLHLSLQAGDDTVLKRMKRRHSRAQAVDFCGRLRELRPGIALGADLIAGFPTETEAMAANSRALVADCGLAYLHVFPFSVRPGTPAARMPQVPGPVRKDRAAALRALGDAARAGFWVGRVGSTASVLVEAPGRGLSEHFAPVRFDGAGAVGEIVTVRLTASDGDGLRGEAV